MQWLAELCVRRSVLASVLMLTIIVVGAAGYARLGVDAFPKIDFPVVSVLTTLDGAAPEEVEVDITEVIEAAVNTISGIDTLSSTSSDGVSQVLVTFKLDRNVDIAAQDVRDHVSQALPDLPKGIDQPVISKLDPDAAPILYVALTGPGSVRDITELADKKVRRAIENIAGVGQVKSIGGRKRQLNVWLDTQAMRALALTGPDVQRAIAAGNLSAPGGNVQNGPNDKTLRVQGRVESPAALGEIIVRSQDSHAVRVRHVAQVEDGAEEEESAAAFNDTPTLILSIRKQSGENTVAVVKAVRERLDEIASSLPRGAELRVVRDASLTIQTQVDAVKEHLVLGALFAALVVLIFLGNLRSTLIAALAIPISLIGTFALMAAMGFTLNIITLLALALAVGIVIDDAIVVLENIFRFIHEKKMKPYPAAIAATKDIGLAVLATTLSLIAVFLPVAFMGGIVGRFLNSFGITMAFAIGVSLLVSFSLTPMLASRWILPAGAHGDKKSWLERGVDVIYMPIERIYVRLLAWSMAHRWVIGVACVLALFSVVPLFKLVPKGFLPVNDEANFQLDVRAPEGTSLQSTRLICDRLGREVRRLPGVLYTMTTVGDNAQKTPNKGTIYVKLSDPKDRAESQQQLAARARRDIVSKESRNLKIDVSDVSAFDSGGSNKQLVYVMNGPDLKVLAATSQRMVEKFRDMPGSADVASSYNAGKMEIRLHVLRDKAAELGVAVQDIASAAQLTVGGLKVSTYEEGGEDYDVRVRAGAQDRTDAAALQLVMVPSSRGTPVPLRDVVRFSEVAGASQIDRLNRQRQVSITANVLAGYGETDMADKLTKLYADENLPSGYTFVPFGRSKETGRAGAAFVTAFGLSLVFMYLVLAAQFESWVHPLTILACLPLTLPFALLSLYIFGQAINIQSALGLLVLFGVVKKNSILQVDQTNQLRARGMPRLDAILEANRDRLRPILMTTVAFVAGMVPLVTAQGIGAGFNRATAGVVVGGQVFSLLLTLLATPIIYSALDDVRNAFARLMARGGSIDRGQAEIGMPAR